MPRKRTSRSQKKRASSPGRTIKKTASKPRKQAGRKATKSTRSSRRNISGTSITKSATFNRNAYWHAFTELQQRADRAIEKLRKDMQRKASLATLVKDRNNILLVLAECDYMVRECSRLSQNERSKR